MIQQKDGIIYITYLSELDKKKEAIKKRIEELRINKHIKYVKKLIYSYKFNDEFNKKALQKHLDNLIEKQKLKN